MNFNIFFTNDCNLNCRYCYEGEKHKKYISKEVLDQVLEFMERVSKGEGITVTTHVETVVLLSRKDCFCK